MGGLITAVVLLSAALVTCLLYISIHRTPKVKSYTTPQQDLISKLVTWVVIHVEVTWGELESKDKANGAINLVLDICKDINIPMTVKMTKTMVDAAVWNYNQTKSFTHTKKADNKTVH